MNEFWKREVMEVIAPVTWASSPRKLVIEAKRIVRFGITSLGVFFLIDWLITGVYAYWGTAFAVVLAVFLLPSVFVGWLQSCAKSGEYNEYQ